MQSIPIKEFKQPLTTSFRIQTTVDLIRFKPIMRDEHRFGNISMISRFPSESRIPGFII